MSIVLVTGASSGFGLMTAKALAEAGHTVYASMRETTGRNAPQVADVAAWAAENKADLRTVELDVQSDASAEAGIAQILADTGRLDVIVHNAGHMVFGPAEAFTPEQLIQQYDVNVLGAQRVNRAALPYLRGQHKGLLVWVGSSSTRGGAPPFLGPYFAAKAAMDVLAVTYSTELALWGIETTIMVPGAFTKGTNHFAHSGKPVDTARVAEYESGPYAGIADKALKGLAGLEPADADPSEVAREIVRVVGLPFGKRPFRVHVDPSQDGAEIVNGVADRMRREMYRNIDLENLLHPAVTAWRSAGRGRLGDRIDRRVALAGMLAFQPHLGRGVSQGAALGRPLGQPVGEADIAPGRDGQLGLSDLDGVRHARVLQNDSLARILERGIHRRVVASSTFAVMARLCSDKPMMTVSITPRGWAGAGRSASNPAETPRANRSRAGRRRSNRP